MSSDSLSYRLLTLLRDVGPTSRAELADRFGVPRQRMLAEIDALAQAGLDPGGRVSPRPGAGGARRWSSSRRTSGSPRSTSARPRSTWRSPTAALEPLAAHSEPADIRSGPKAILAHRQRGARASSKPMGCTTGCTRSASACPARSASATACRCRHRSCPGWDRYPVRDVLAREHSCCPVVVDNDVNIMAIGERHGGVATLGRQPAVRQDRHRHRLRHLPRRRGLPGHRRLRRRHRPHPGRRRTGRCAPAATPAAWRRCSAAPRWPETRLAAARAGTSPVLAARLAERRSGDREGRRRRRGRGRSPPASGSSATAAAGSASCSPGWSASSTRR